MRFGIVQCLRLLTAQCSAAHSVHPGLCSASPTRRAYNLRFRLLGRQESHHRLLAGQLPCSPLHRRGPLFEDKLSVRSVSPPKTKEGKVGLLPDSPTLTGRLFTRSSRTLTESSSGFARLGVVTRPFGDRAHFEDRESETSGNYTESGQADHKNCCVRQHLNASLQLHESRCRDR